MRNSLARALRAASVSLFMMGTLRSLLSAPSPADPVAVAAANALGIDLLHQSCRPDANALLSPYSIQTALAMAYAGADGATRQALVLTIANRLFGQSGYAFRHPFLNLLNDSYGAPFEALDFRNEPAPAARHINGWVETQTRQRIRNLISETALSDLTRLVVVNAIYLKAPWAHPFEVSATKPGPFYVDGSQRVDVPMMNQTHELPFAQGDGFVAVALPLAYPFQFIIFLPAQRDGLARLEKQLSAAMLGGNLRWVERDVTLYFPRFKLEPPVLSLGAALRGLGMESAFDIPPGSANFDRIAPRRPEDYLALSDVFHKTFLDLDEEGVEAAAATALVAMLAGVREPPKPVEVRVEHPFLFAIVNQLTREPSGGACLFLGHVTDPR